ncbi:Unknown protein, partial [Striga hermonthica]
TNRVTHLGNTTSCRVESAHSVLKRWLHTSTGALDTMWQKIDAEIKSQMTGISQDNQRQDNQSAWTDVDVFRTFVQEVEEGDPATIRYMNHLMYAQLYPEQQAYAEPEVKENTRGRPKKTDSTKRKLSRWEYRDNSRGRPVGRTSTFLHGPTNTSSRGTKNTSSRGPTSSQSSQPSQEAPQ